jgi:hypothetical protein
LKNDPGGPTNTFTSVTTSGVPKSYTYDAAGNMTDDGMHTCVYDEDDQLADVDNGSASYC